MRQYASKKKELTWARFFAYAIIIVAAVIFVWRVVDSLYQTALHYQHK